MDTLTQWEQTCDDLTAEIAGWNEPVPEGSPKIDRVEFRSGPIQQLSLVRPARNTPGGCAIFRKPETRETADGDNYLEYKIGRVAQSSSDVLNRAVTLTAVTIDRRFAPAKSPARKPYLRISPRHGTGTHFAVTSLQSRPAAPDYVRGTRYVNPTGQFCPKLEALYEAEDGSLDRITLNLRMGDLNMPDDIASVILSVNAIEGETVHSQVVRAMGGDWQLVYGRGDKAHLYFEQHSRTTPGLLATYEVPKELNTDSVRRLIRGAFEQANPDFDGQLIK